MKRAALAILLLALLAPRGLAAESELLDVGVTSVSGRSVYIDAGRDAGIEPGAILVLLIDGARVEATILDVSSNNARAELPPDVGVPVVGDRGEILVIFPEPEASEEPADEKPQTPEHPPWQRSVEPREDDTPLLAPAFSRPPEERPTEVSGRIYSLLSYSHDSGGSRGSDYTFARLGATVEVTNPFKRAGRLLFSGDIDYRGADLTDRDQTDTDIRLDRLSYAIGGHEFSSYRLELGRFTSVYAPELGLVDGVEGAVLLENNWAIGAGVGLYPAPFPERDEGDDYGFHLFADYHSPKEPYLDATVAFQQTWHTEAPDRSLLLARANYRPTDQWWLYGLVLADIFAPNDTVETSDIDATQVILQARYTPDRNKGGYVSYVRTTYPELRRRDFASLPDELIRDGHVDRITLNGWKRITDDVRLSARANYWIDQDNDGLGGELSADWNDVWRDTSALYAAVYYAGATFNDGVGLRLQARDRFDDFYVSGGYDVFRYTAKGLATGDETSTRHTLRSDVSWSRGRWHYSVNASYNLGDAESAINLGLFMEYRF